MCTGTSRSTRLEPTTVALNSMPRNPMLLNWLRRMRDERGAAFVRALGEGTKVMRDEMLKLSLCSKFILTLERVLGISFIGFLGAANLPQSSQMNWSSVCEGYEILAVIVFGSTGRGDSGNKSDLDVFALCPNDFSSRLDAIQDGLADRLSCDTFSIVVYTEAQFRKMLARGSLFAWHLKLEGIVVSSKLDMGKVFPNCSLTHSTAKI